MGGSDALGGYHLLALAQRPQAARPGNRRRRRWTSTWWLCKLSGTATRIDKPKNKGKLAVRSISLQNIFKKRESSDLFENSDLSCRRGMRLPGSVPIAASGQILMDSVNRQ